MQGTTVIGSDRITISDDDTLLVDGSRTEEGAESVSTVAERVEQSSAQPSIPVHLLASGKIRGLGGSGAV